MNRHYRAGKEKKPEIWRSARPERGWYGWIYGVRKMAMEPDCDGVCVWYNTKFDQTSPPRDN